MRKIILIIFVTFLCLVGCSKPGQSTEGCYPTALMWNNSMYSPGINSPIDESTINSELGKIIKQVQPMPKKDGEINDVRNFNVGDRIFSIKDIEITEAIAIMKDGKYFRIDRIRSSVGIVWDNKMYDFNGNFDNENEKFDKEIGQIKRVGIAYSDAVNGDVTGNGTTGDLSIFPIGGRISTIKNTDSTTAIAVEDKDGRFHKAVYIKRVLK